MNPTPPPSSKPGLGRTLPAGQTQTNYNSVYVQVGLFAFNPTLVSAFLHRPSNDESTPITEVFYGSHHVTVPDSNQALFFYLRSYSKPQEIATKL